MRGAILTRLAAVFALLTFAAPAFASHSLADAVPDGPVADIVRKSLHLLEEGEETEDHAAKMEIYQRGKDLADEALAKDPNSADAHFALFGNWGRMLQTDGWLKNAHNLPALWRELDRTLELNPDHAAALGAKGGLYLQLPGFLGGSLAKAEPLLRRAVELDPFSVGARLELADCCLQTDRREEAHALTVAALKLAHDQEKPRFVARATDLLEQMGDDQTAPRLAAASAGSSHGE